MLCRLRSEILELCFKRPKPKFSHIYLWKVIIKKKRFPDRSSSLAGSSSPERIIKLRTLSHLQKNFEKTDSYYSRTHFTTIKASQGLQGGKKSKHNLCKLCDTQASGWGLMYFNQKYNLSKVWVSSLCFFCPLNGRKLWLRLNRLSGIHS